MEAGAVVTVYARDLSKAASLADSFGVREEPMAETFAGTDIVVNCTPLGTKGDKEDQTIASANGLGGVKLVYDLVYYPTVTRLICVAKAAGVQTLGGLVMLIAQAAEQFKIWTRVAAPIDVMTEAVRKKLNL
jgi:shikimate 5-dehydrogenase